VESVCGPVVWVPSRHAPRKLKILRCAGSSFDSVAMICVNHTRVRRTIPKGARPFHPRASESRVATIQSGSGRLERVIEPSEEAEGLAVGA